MKQKIFLTILFLYLFCVSGVYGVDGLSLVLSPLPINLITEPGSTVSAQLKIKNNGDEAEQLQVGLMKFSAYGDEGKPRLMDREKGDNYFDWMKFSEDNFKINPNEWKTITATITVPPEAAFGYYYAVTFSRSSNESNLGPRETKIVGATASLILLEVRVPNAIREVEVQEFSTTKKVFEFLPVDFKIVLKNKGNVHIVPKGDIFIDSGDKKDLAILTINDTSGNVLPNSKRIFTSQWNDGFPVYTPKTEGEVIKTDRKGKVINDLIWDFSRVAKLRLGKFTATMLLVYDDGTRDIPIEGKLSFWVVPWRILGIGLVVVLLLGLGLWSIIRNIVNKFGRKK